MSHFSSITVGPYDLRDQGSLARVSRIQRGTSNIDPGSVPATSSIEVSVAIQGAAPGDFVLFEPPASLEAGLVPCVIGRVSAANTVQLRLTNVTGSPIDGAALSWRWLLIKTT